MSIHFNGKWIAHLHHNQGSGSIELSVLREDNLHGKRSYGWAGQDKIILLSGEINFRLNSCIPIMMSIAEKFTQKLNRKEYQS